MLFYVALGARGNAVLEGRAVPWFGLTRRRRLPRQVGNWWGYRLSGPMTIRMTRESCFQITRCVSRNNNCIDISSIGRRAHDGIGLKEVIDNDDAGDSFPEYDWWIRLAHNDRLWHRAKISEPEVCPYRR